jgi:hypothetical protein
MIKRRGQMAIFVIIAIVIVAAIVIYFVFRGGIGAEDYPAELAPVFDYYQGCIELETQAAISLAESQGGYIEIPNYVPGSEYAPSSSQLNFLGTPVPYWFYVSENGVIKEQVPTLPEIESQMEEYILQGLDYCNFESYYISGFAIERNAGKVSVDVKENSVEVQVDSPLSVRRGEDSATKATHSAKVESKFGKFYATAKKIYARQKTDAVLENYATDVLRMYAPVDGVEIKCSPLIWSTEKVMSDLKSGLEENFKTIKFQGDYYKLKDDIRKYFVINEEVDENINVLYSRNWATKIDISGDQVDNEIMMAEPVGLDEGMGMMGFCYIPYHFVYDLSFPVLIQVFNNNEMFQFPVVVIVENNVPREAITGETIIAEEEEFDLCKYYTQSIQVNLFDSNLNPVNGNISYECFSQKCRLGMSENGVWKGYAPACVNGYLNVKSEGFADKKQTFSSNSEVYADVLLEREYNLEVDVQVDNQKLTDTAIVSFVRDDGKASSMVAPEINTLRLSEGNYQATVYVYGNSSIVIPATKKTKCTEVPRGGILGFMGMTKEQCFDIAVPETRIDYALIGGGKQTAYILESELEKGKLTLNVERLPRPDSLDKLQNNFEIFEEKGVNLEFHG